MNAEELSRAEQAEEREERKEFEREQSFINRSSSGEMAELRFDDDE